MEPNYFLISFDASVMPRRRHPDLYSVLDELAAVEAHQSAYLVEFNGSSAELMRKLQGNPDRKLVMLLVQLHGANNDWYLNKIPGGWLRARGLSLHTGE